MKHKTQIWNWLRHLPHHTLVPGDQVNIPDLPVFLLFSIQKATKWHSRILLFTPFITAIDTVLLQWSALAVPQQNVPYYKLYLVHILYHWIQSILHFIIFKAIFLSTTCISTVKVKLGSSDTEWIWLGSAPVECSTCAHEDTAEWQIKSYWTFSVCKIHVLFDK